MVALIDPWRTKPTPDWLLTERRKQRARARSEAQAQQRADARKARLGQRETHLTVRMAREWVAQAHPETMRFSAREWRAVVVLVVLSKASEPMSPRAVSAELHTDQTTALAALTDLHRWGLAESVVIQTHAARPPKSSPLRWKLA